MVTSQSQRKIWRESIQEDCSQQGTERPWVSHPRKVTACQMVLSEPSSWYPFPCRVPTLACGLDLVTSF